MPRGRKIDPKLRAQTVKAVAKRYQAGASIREIAGGLNMSYGLTHRMVTESGVPLRPRGGSTRR